MITIPCDTCGTPVLIYPPEDGEDCTATCGRCAHNATAVITPNTDERN